MVVVVGRTPDQIKVTRAQYIDLLSRLDRGTRSTNKAEADLSYELLDLVRVWCAQATDAGEVDGQLQLPLNWA